MQTSESLEINKHLRHNYIVNILDGTFFGFALGFSSFSTVIPLFVANFTDSAIIIGLVSAIHSVGWQLPQLLTAKKISRMERFKPFVMLMTVNERIPFLGLALLAFFSSSMDKNLVIVIMLLLLIWQALGGGFAANAWQNMIHRIIPGEYLATFFGIQASAANLLSGLGALLAGFILNQHSFPYDFSLCFLLAFVCLFISFFALNLTREPRRVIPSNPFLSSTLWTDIKTIWQKDLPFRWFLLFRVLSQFGMMAFSFFAVYAVHYLNMNEAEAGIMTSVFLISMTIANPFLGWLADRWSRKWTLGIGALCCVISCSIAWFASSSVWFIIAVIFAGFTSTAFWTIVMAVTLTFGNSSERPTYVGMSNTLIAPFTIFAPILGGWLADIAGFKASFALSAVAGLLIFFIILIFIKDARTSSGEN